RAASASRSYHFVGVQIADASVFQSLSDGVPSETVNDIYPRLIAAHPQAIGAFVCDASSATSARPRTTWKRRFTWPDWREIAWPAEAASKFIRPLRSSV